MSFYAVNVFSQWSNNPLISNELISETNNPVDISVSEDNLGGAFIVWQDTKQSQTPDIFFQHFNVDGYVSFKSSGKRVSNLKGPKVNPVLSNSHGNISVVLWKDFSAENNGNLYIQKLQTNGNLLWGEHGVAIAQGNNEILNYSCSLDKNGIAYISFVEKNNLSISSYTVYFQKISATGEPMFNSPIRISSSANAKNFSSVFSDDKGGAYILWIENENNIAQVRSQHIDESGNFDWKKEPNILSGQVASVFIYRAIKVNSNLIYLCWQTQGKQKKIYHQLFNLAGNNIYGVSGLAIPCKKGTPSNPIPLLASDSTIILCWINELNNDKDIYVQKFRLNGKVLWSEDSAAYLKLKGNQFAQSITSDGRGGAIIAYFEKAENNLQPDIYAQRISRKGEFLWGVGGVALANSPNSEKSYLNLIPDQNNGVIGIFKEKRNGSIGIYGQRVFSNKTYSSQVVDFSTTLVGDSVLINWKTSNEKEIFTYKIDRLIQGESADSSWKEIATILSNGLQRTNNYQYLDFPNTAGTIFYRLRQYDRNGVEQLSEITRVDFISEDINEPMVFQNIPNPFSDSTSITFILPYEQRVKFEIYNSRVELIKEFYIENTIAGRNKIYFSAENIPPGIYFYRFTAGDYTQVKKMIVTR